MNNKAYINKLATKLRIWDARIEEIQHEAQDRTAAARKRVDHAVALFNARRVALTEKVTDAQRRGTSAWGHLRTGLQKSWTDLHDAGRKVRKAIG